MIVGVLLAAGAGTRFGGEKLLAALPDGTPVGVRSARALKSGVSRALAVVRPSDAVLGALLSAEGLEVFPFPGADEGMGASLAFGVSRVPSADGWLVALADMPYVEPSTVAAVAGALRAGALVAAPSFRGRRGHPVGFGAAIYPELIQLGGDEGARSLVANHSTQVVLLECDDLGILRDVDASRDLTDESDDRYR